MLSLDNKGYYLLRLYDLRLSMMLSNTVLSSKTVLSDNINTIFNLDKYYGYSIDLIPYNIRSMGYSLSSLVSS